MNYGRCEHRPHFPRTVLLAILPLLALLCGPLSAQEQGPQLPGLNAFMEQARKALAEGKPESLHALASTPQTLSWLAHRTRFGDTNWKLHLLRMPQPPGRQASDPYVAVFSAFHSVQGISDHVHQLVKQGAEWRLGPELPETDTRGYRIRDHKLTVRFDLPAATGFFTDEVSFERTTAKPGDPCLFRLSAIMNVESVTLGGKPIPFSYVPGVVAFTPPRDTPKFTLGLVYGGAFTVPGMDTYIKTSEVFLNAYWYPQIARLPAKHGVTATVPKGWTAVGQGELVRRTEVTDGTLFQFRHEIPTVFFSLDAGPYVITTREVNGRKLSAYQLRADPADAARALDTLSKTLAFFEQQFGPFPYTHYEMVQTLGPFGGALEAYSFATFQGRRFAAIEHELAHTWWGGIVPNPYTHTLWNEAFASYSDNMSQRRLGGHKDQPALTGMHRAPGFGRALITQYAVPIKDAFDTESGTHNAVGYGKGALVLAMLEDTIGFEAMMRSMRRFRDNVVPGEPADWPDFERAVKETTGKDYRWFFEQWNERAGVPVVKLVDVKKSVEGGETVVTARIVQEGKPYRLAIPVALETAGGPVIRQTVRVDGPSAEIRLKAKAAPVALRLDPDGTILMAGAKLAEPGGDPFAFKF